MTNKKPSRNIIDEFRNASFEVVEDVPFVEKDYILKFKQRR